MTEKIERIARTVLWLTLAVVIAAVPIVMKSKQAEIEQVREQMAAALDKAEKDLAAMAEKEPDLFDPKWAGTVFQALLRKSAKGSISFTNATPHHGFLCLKGTAKNSETGQTTESLATCREIQPYESNIEMIFEFAGQSFNRVCPEDAECEFTPEPLEKKSPEKK